MTFKYRYRKQIICVVLLVIIISSFTGFYYFNNEEDKTEKKLLVSSEKVESKIKKEKLENKQEVKEIMVDVKGEVINSGIYTLKDGSRVIDAINMAGGLTNNADTSVLNLSKKLTDEMVIIVYSYYEF